MGEAAGSTGRDGPDDVVNEGVALPGILPCFVQTADDAVFALVNEAEIGEGDGSIGIANAIPGVSGGTIAFVLGIYEKLTYSISILPNALIKLKWDEIKESLKVLIPVALGAAISIVLFLKLINYTFTYYPIPTRIFFVGLILGSFPFITKTVEEFNFKVFISFFVCDFIMAIFV